MTTTKFEVKKHGFHFDNGTFRTSVGPFPCSVLCGGMSYSALDYFKCGIRVPELTKAPAEGNPLEKYLYRRQMTAHYYTWHLFLAAWSAPIPLLGVTSSLVQGSMKELDYYLSSEGPLVMCLFENMGTGHHVLAIGCDKAKQRIELYDNNHHDRNCNLTYKNGIWQHSLSSTKWKGWFLDWGHYTDGTRLPPLSWRFCKKCHSLVTTSFGQTGKCHAGGSHSHNLVFEYFLPCFVNEGERGWRVCSKCQALFYSPSGQATGWCADSNNHTPMSLGKQLLEFGVDSSGQGEKKWHMCKLCFGLFWAGSGNGTCTVGGTHERSSKQYVVAHRTV
ncbi:MAG: hypothetical protein K6T86_01600 [Pirellulales bacterium]|nr:hypothetical protein [Pirellulales bacterium]